MGKDERDEAGDTGVIQSTLNFTTVYTSGLASGCKGACNPVIPCP